MTTVDSNLQKALDYCINSGATVEQSAKQFGVSKEELSELLSEMLNPLGGGEIGDKAEFRKYGDAKVAHAKLKIGAQTFNIVAVGIDGAEGASYRVYDKFGNSISAQDLKDTFKIDSFRINDNGQISVQVYPDAPEMHMEQRTDAKYGFIDTIKNFWTRGAKEAEKFIAVVTPDGAKTPNGKGVSADVAAEGNSALAQAGTTGGTAAGTATGGVKGSNRNSTAAAGIRNSSPEAVSADFANTAERYGLGKEYAGLNDKVQQGWAGLSNEDKKTATDLAASAAEKLEQGDTAGAKEEASKLQAFLGKFIPGLGLIDLPDEVVAACLVVSVVGIAYAAAAGGLAAGAAALASRIASSSAGKVAAMAFAGIAMASCSPEDDPINISQNVAITITQNSSLEEAIQALKDGQEVTNNLLAQILEREIQNGATLEEIKELVGENSWILTKLVDSMTENNQLLTDIRDSITSGTEDVLSAIISLQNSVDVLTALVAENPDYKEDLQAILDAINSGNESLTQVMSMVTNLFAQLQANGEIQADILAKLDEIQNSNKSDGEKLVEILNLLASINNKLDTVINQINQSFDNDQDVKAALEKLTQLVEDGNAKADVTNELLNKLLKMMENGVSKEDIKAIIEAISQNGDKIDDVNFFLNKIQNQNQEFQQKVLDMVAKYGDVVFKLLEAAQGSDAKLDAIAQLLAKIQGQDETFQQNILNVINDLGTNSTTVLNDILASIGNNGEKLDAIAQLLAKIDSNVEKYGEEGKALGNEILNAIKTLGADISGKLTQILNVANSGSDTGKAVMELLNKVLEKLDSMDSNRKAEAEAIIDAIANIKVDGGGNGNVDLSSVEKMLSELLELTAKNNGLLESIDGKMDVINVTIETAKNEILAKMDKNDANTTAILNALNEFKNISNANDKEIIEKMDTIINILNNIEDNKYDDTDLMAKLDDILAAIKDHEVKVEVNGKVTCECNCGGNHEGILGNLKDVLG